MASVGLPEELDRLIQREQAGERRLWAGRSSPRAAFWATVGIWLFAVPWTAFALFWETMALGVLLFAPRPPETGLWAVAGMGVFALFGLPFVVIGFGMLATPWLAARDAARTAWVVTDARVMRMKAGRAREYHSWTAQQIVSVRRRERADGAGDLTLSFGWTTDSDGDRVEKTETIRGVAKVREVEVMVRRLLPTR